MTAPNDNAFEREHEPWSDRSHQQPAERGSDRATEIDARAPERHGLGELLRRYELGLNRLPRGIVEGHADAERERQHEQRSRAHLARGVEQCERACGDQHHRLGHEQHPPTIRQDPPGRHR